MATSLLLNELIDWSSPPPSLVLVSEACDLNLARALLIPADQIGGPNSTRICSKICDCARNHSYQCNMGHLREVSSQSLSLSLRDQFSIPCISSPHLHNAFNRVHLGLARVLGWTTKSSLDAATISRAPPKANRTWMCKEEALSWIKFGYHGLISLYCCFLRQLILEIKAPILTTLLVRDVERNADILWVGSTLNRF
jgi:hypothetical protein